MFKELNDLVSLISFIEFFGRIKLKIPVDVKVKIINQVLSRKPDTPMSTHLFAMRNDCHNYKERVLINKLIKAHFKGLTKDYKQRNLKSIINELQTTMGDGQIIKEKLNREWQKKQKI